MEYFKMLNQNCVGSHAEVKIELHKAMDMILAYDDEYQKLCYEDIKEAEFYDRCERISDRIYNLLQSVEDNYYCGDYTIIARKEDN